MPKSEDPDVTIDITARTATTSGTLAENATRFQAVVEREATEIVASPRRIDAPRYVLGRQLGAGGMGTVILASDEVLARPVALKILNAQDEESRRSFAREATLAARLDHPNIVPLYDAGVGNDGKPYLAMRYVEGTTLRELIRRLSAGDRDAHERYPLEARCRMMLQLLDALALAHARGVLHRDLKPENVMLGPFGEVLLLDWGIACAPDETGLPNDGVTGTVRYMSPEQLRGEKLDARTDLWSLSVLFYELLTLVHPFAELASSPASRLSQMARAPPKAAELLRHARQPVVPRALSLVVMKGLEENRDARFASAVDMARALELVLAGNAPIVCPHTAYQRGLGAIGHALDAYPRLIYAATALLVALAAVGAATLAQTVLAMRAG